MNSQGELIQPRLSLLTRCRQVLQVKVPDQVCTGVQQLDEQGGLPLGVGDLQIEGRRTQPVWEREGNNS